MSRLTALERAFELARTGKFQTIEHIKQKLKREGLDANQIEGPVRSHCRYAPGAAPVQGRVDSDRAF